VVLEEDPLRFPPDRFRELPIRMTITGGRVVYALDRDGEAPAASPTQLPDGDIDCACPE
jgi:hypothetical protein